MSKCNKVFMGAVCAAVMLAATSALAADTQTMTVSAAVLGVCKFTSSAYTMTFTNIDPASVASATQTTTIGYKCTKNTGPAAITFAGGATGTIVSLPGVGTPANTLPVTLSWTNPVTLGSGFGVASTPISFAVTGTITAANFSNAPADTYTTGVLVAILP